MQDEAQLVQSTIPPSLPARLGHPPQKTPTPELMSTDLAALVGESYERAYTDMVRVQQLTELEEVVAYKEALGR